MVIEKIEKMYKNIGRNLSVKGKTLLMRQYYIQLLNIQIDYILFIQQLSSSMEGKAVSPPASTEDNTKVKFKTEVQQFDTSYIQNDSFQRESSKEMITHYVQVIKEKYQTERKPLSILDYCCGHGLPTFDIINQLLKNNVEIEKVRGYDISKENIQYANKNNPYDFVSFFIKNLDTEFQEVGEYDVIISIYGLHWLNNTKLAIENIHRSLKQDGLIFFIIPIEQPDQYEVRQKFISSPRWAPQFNPSQFKLPKFHESPEAYVDEFRKYFSVLKDQANVLRYEWTKEQLKAVLRSFIPEIRHLIHGQKSALKREILSKTFLNQLYDSIPDGLDKQYLKKNGDKVIHSRKVLFFEGKKLEIPAN